MPLNQGLIACPCDPTSRDEVPGLAIDPHSFAMIPGELEPGFLGYYPLGAYGGEDISGRENHATQLVPPFGSDNGILCEFAEKMNGTQGYKMPFELESAFTFSIFGKPYAGYDQTIFRVGESLVFGITQAMQLIISLEGGVTLSGGTLEDGEWYHLALVRRNYQYSIAVNGSFTELRYGTRTSERLLAFYDVPGGEAVVGRTGEIIGPVGLWQDVAIRKTSLREEEILAEYTSYCTSILEVVT